MSPDAITVSMVFVQAALSKLPVGQPGRARALATAGVPESLLAMPQARVSAQQFAALWLAVVGELEDEMFGLDQRQMPPGSFALICHALMSAKTLGQALERCLRGFAVFLVDLRAQLRVEGDTARLILLSQPPRTPEQMFGQEIFATVLHGVMCWLGRQRVPLSHACFNYARPPHWAEYGAMFSKSLSFDAAHTELHFDTRWLARPCLQDEAGLKRFLASAPLSIFVKYRNPHSWSARVRRQLRETRPAHWPSLQAQAQALGMAPNTLARRLDEEGTRYQRIKDDLRRDRAIQLLSGTRRSIEDIASELGYEEPSAFYRAFRRWTGTVPGSYRADASQ